MKLERIKGTEAGASGGRRRILIIAAIVIVVALIAWWLLSRPGLPEASPPATAGSRPTRSISPPNIPGGSSEVLVNEGDTVEAGQVVARMDTEELEAQLRQAEAQIREAEDAQRVARADVAARRAQVGARSAEVERKQAEANYRPAAVRALARAWCRPARSASRKRETRQCADAFDPRHGRGNAGPDGGRAGRSGRRRRPRRSAPSRRSPRRAAEADRIRAQIRDSVLVAPIRGRVESRLAEPGEVLAAGGRVFSLVDLSDVYMYVFLPEQVTGKHRHRLGSADRARRGAAISDPRLRLLHLADRAVHAQDGRDRRRSATTSPSA